MFSISGVVVEYPGKVVLGNISVQINPKDKIGLVGKNGSGKTTLLKIFAGVFSPHKGSISIPDGKTIGYLPQEMEHKTGKKIMEIANEAFEEINSLEEEIAFIENKVSHYQEGQAEELEKWLTELDEKHHRLNYLEGSKKHGNVEKVLKGLGFMPEEFSKDISTFSGGWQMRAELAKILLTMPDLVLLDEPTNHLDIDSIIWLEQFFTNYPGAVMIVSHDRMFLDRITSRTIELVKGKLYDYKLSYSKFLEVREERIQAQLAAARNQNRLYEQQEKFIERFRYKATKARQVQSKLKLINKIEKVEVDELDSAEVRFYFPPAPRSGAVVSEAKGLTKTYDNKIVLKDISFTIERGERIAFVGKNGEGKTTLVKILMGEEPFTGEFKAGYNVYPGYYAQVQERTLDDSLSVLETLQQGASGEWANMAKLRGLLGAFLFNEDDVEKKVKVLSGGEKSRLAIARLLLFPANLLILDEPTNHLDASSKEVLKQALLKYDGTLILVSHDRDFLRGLTNRTFFFSGKKIHEYPGTIDEFLAKHKVETFRDFEQALSANLSKKGTGRNQEMVPDAGRSREKYRQRKEIEKEIRRAEKAVVFTEERISKLEKEIKNLEEIMQTPDFFANPENARKIFAEHESTQKQLAAALDEWEKAQSELDDLLKIKTSAFN